MQGINLRGDNSMYQGEANDDNGAFHGCKVGKREGKSKGSVVF
jgi:hypothetical protein